MALSPDVLTEIEQALSAPDVDAAAVAALRGRFPHLSWTRCDASDVVETPFRSLARFALHPVDTADHCVQITTDPERATGIIVARRT